MKTLGPALLCLVGCATTSGAHRSVELAASLEQSVVEKSVDGIQILVDRIPHVKLVSALLFIKGGVRDWGADNAGVERLALATAVAGGTEQLPKADFSRSLAALGSQLAAETGEDFSVVEVKALADRWRPSLNLMADALLHPALPPSEIELQRALQLSALRQEQEEPDALAAKEAHDLFYQGTPYAHRAVGTAASVGALTRADLVAQLAKIRETSRWLLVVVGDVDPVEVAAWASTAFADVPRGAYRDAPLAQPAFPSPRLSARTLPLPTTYVVATFPAPGWRDPQLAVAEVAMNALREKLFEEVRTKRQLSYDPGAELSPEGGGVGSISVTAEDPNRTFRVVLDVLHLLQTDRLDADSLEGDKRIFLTQLLLRSETTDGLAALLGRAAVEGGDWRLAGTLLDRVRRVTAEQVRDFLQRRVKKLQTAVLGPPDVVDRGLFTST